MTSPAAARAESSVVKDVIRKTWTDLRRHDARRFEEAYAPDCSLWVGETRLEGLEEMDRYMRWVRETYTEVNAIERRLDVSVNGEEASGRADVWLALTARQGQAVYNLDARADYRLRKTAEGWRIAEGRMRVLRRRTLVKHGLLNYVRLMRHGKELFPATLPKAA
jgi:ketosteroid isomerase-like protein